MDWKSNLSWEVAQERSKIIGKIRDFFSCRSIVEVETPLLARGTVTDVYLEGFQCRYDFLDTSNGSESSTLYLQTSPEYAMKRLLSSGFGSIYQVCKAFRHEEAGTHHNPEFSILEWYRVGFDHYQLMVEVSDFLVDVIGCPKAISYTYQEVFLKYLNIDPLVAPIEVLKHTLENNGVTGDWIELERDPDILLQVLFSECIEKQIGTEQPCFVLNFPASQASLARISEEDNRVAERFECYYLGLELANGFHELTSSEEQKARFIDDNRKRANLGLEQKPIDSKLLEALTNGLPNCAGVALGVDRLLMIALGKNRISETMPFTTKNT